VGPGRVAAAEGQAVAAGPAGQGPSHLKRPAVSLSIRDPGAFGLLAAIAAVVTVALAATPTRLTAAAAGSAAVPGPILAEPPPRPDRSATYLFYLHGRIVQEEGRRAVSPRFGRYAYDDILGRLAAEGFVVIGEVRRRDTEAPAYAARVAGQIERLLAAGVPARRITVVGASMGGFIALLVSSRLAVPDLGYVILGGCGDGTIDLGGVLHGDLLSIFETSDELAGSCGPTFARAAAAGRRDEVRLDTGLRHGFLYRPLPAWMEPAIRWARERRAGGDEDRPA
jgi:hypothetical protein